MNTLTSRPRKVLLNSTLAFTKRPAAARPSFWGSNESTKSEHVKQLQPPSPGHEQCMIEHHEGRRHKSTVTNETARNDSLRQELKAFPRSKNLRSAQWETIRRTGHRYGQRQNDEGSPSLVQSSQYCYRISLRDVEAISDSSHSVPQKVKTENRATSSVMKSMNASAVLDPLSFCKGSARLPPHVNRGSKSRNGADAARQLLRGKRDFFLAARKLNDDPVVLDGHGVPPALFQHCIDMADALLRHYGPDIVECSFRNHNRSNETSAKAPLQVKVRRRDATNSCLPAPSVVHTSGSDNENNCGKSLENNDEIDWDHNLNLYLTVMERLAKNLGRVLDLPSFRTESGKVVGHVNDRSSGEHCKSDNAHDRDSDDNIDLSSLLFPSPPPLWNVDILRGAYFDFEPVGNVVGSKRQTFDSEPPTNTEEQNYGIDEEDRYGALAQPKTGRTVDGLPFPVVEFVQQRGPRSSGNVLIRLQGYPRANEEFDRMGSQQHQRQPVSLVFDACIQNPMSVQH